MKRILVVAILAVLVVSFVPSPARAQCGQDCSIYPPLASIPTPPSRTFTEFIEGAYWGAYGRHATSDELCAEFGQLLVAENNGHRADEAKRFVATLFETPDSYGGATYEATAEYGALNHDLNQFVTDLYHAFLQREPDDAGHCFWVNDTCSDPGGKRHTIEAFVVSIEFGRLIDALTVGSQPSCIDPGCGDDPKCRHDCGINPDCLEYFGARLPPW